MIRVGPAGWSYPDWDGIVYPRSRPPGFHPLAHLVRFFDCVEINSSFYAPPRAEHAERWAAIARGKPSFRFVAKLHRDFTHGPAPGELAGADWEEKARRLLGGLAPLSRAGLLSTLLVQFPVQFLHAPESVRRLGRIARLFHPLPLTAELRHESWFTPPALDAVRGVGMSLAHIDLPPAWNHPPPWHPSTGPIGYLRLHGRNADTWFRAGVGRDDRYDYLYPPEELAAVAERAERLARDHDEVFVVTNNHFGGQAVANAIELVAALSGEAPAAPAELLDRFPRLAGIARAEGQKRLY
ncbi:MAG: DUF72 domain-containing protein [Planctomycetota bacterium]|nr:DUF72 domain-containing protein [Planctomycetota bacterium]